MVSFAFKGNTPAVKPVATPLIAIPVTVPPDTNKIVLIDVDGVYAVPDVGTVTEVGAVPPPAVFHVPPISKYDEPVKETILLKKTSPINVCACSHLLARLSQFNTLCIILLIFSPLRKI